MTLHDVISNAAHSGSTQLLGSLFGGDIYKIVGSGHFNGPAETMVTFFAELLVPFAAFLYMFLAVYFIGSGVVNKAQSGDFMKGSWNGMWPFLRIGLGLTAVAPAGVVKHLVAIQAFVLMIALLGSGVADLSWRGLLHLSSEAGIMAKETVIPAIDPNKTDAYLNQAFQYSACVVNKIQFDNTDPSLTLSSFDPIHPDTTPASAAVANACAGAGFLLYLKNANSVTAPDRPDLTPQKGNDLIDSDTMAKFNEYQGKQIRYLENQTVLDFIQNQVWPFYTQNATTFGLTTVPMALGEQWQKILASFHATLTAKLKSAIAADKAMVADVFDTSISKYGWISAAGYYRQLAQEQQTINSQITAGLQSSPNYVDMDKQTDLTGANGMDDFRIKRAREWVNKPPVSPWSSTQKTALYALGINYLKMGNKTDPILAMTHFGQRLEGAAELLFGARHLPKIYSWIPFIGTKINNMVNSVFMDVVLMVLAVAGLVLGVILPSLPWIIFMFAIISWLIHVAEMFIAAPFWMVVNALPEGGTFLSNVAKKGFNNALFIFLFPLFAIGGLVVSLAISWVGMKILNHFIYISFEGLKGFTLPFDALGHIIIYVVLAWMIMTSSLSLIQGLPRTVLNMFSLSQPGLNQFDNKHEDAIDKTMAPANVPGTIQKARESLGGMEKESASNKRDKIQEEGLRSDSTADDNREGN